MIEIRTTTRQDRGRPDIISGWLRRALLAPLFAALLLAPVAAGAQEWEDTGADAVVSFTPGMGAGHGAEHFPGNVLGLPDPTAGDKVATIDPKQVLSLGVGGEIILRFDRHPIIDRPGADFTVFENPFYHTIGGKERIYAEPAEIAVSRDGVEFIAYPFDSLTLEGAAGVTPTNGGADPGNPQVSGGDSFDLAQLGIDSVRFIRIRDVEAIIMNNRKHPFWDPTLNGAPPTSGFDLDAVVRVTGGSGNPSAVEYDAGDHRGSLSAAVMPNPSAGDAVLRLRLEKGGDVRARLFDAMGRQVRVVSEGRLEAGEWRFALGMEEHPAGIYFLLLEVEGHTPRTIRVMHIAEGE